MVKLSVIVASYNHAHTICRAIESVMFALSGISHEIIVVDDGSTDGSVELINKYNVEKHFLKHGGMMHTYQYALSQVSGEYFTFCDADDYWVGAKKVNQLKTMDRCGYNFTVARVYIEKEGRCKSSGGNIIELQRGITFDNLLMGKSNIHAQSYMIRTSKFREYIDFNKFMNFNVWDYPIVLEWMRHDTIRYYNDIVAVFCVEEESVTQTRDRKRRLKYILGNHKIKWYFIRKYGCKLNTKLYLVYKFARDIYSVIFKRWI